MKIFIFTVIVETPGTPNVGVRFEEMVTAEDSVNAQMALDVLMGLRYRGREFSIELRHELEA